MVLPLCVTTLILFFVEVCYSQQQDTTLPVTLSPVIINGTGNGACPPQDAIDAQSYSIKSEILNILDNTVIPKLSCPCSTSGETWTRIAYLDMTDTNQQCPTNWRLNTFGSIRGCGQTSIGGNSAIFPSNGRTSSRVCGKIIAYQRGNPDGFGPFFFGNSDNLEGGYLDGISLTYGPAGSRQHIWSFAAAPYDTLDTFDVRRTCPCTNINEPGPYLVPPFIGNDYFCDTGNPTGRNTTAFYSDNPLWDGAGCPSTSTCCQFNTPPYFCKALPQPTSEDIEIRIFLNSDRFDEDVIVSLIDIYVQ